MSKALLLVAAERRELAGVLPHCRNVERPAWPLDFAVAGELGGEAVVMVAHGPGPVLASEAVRFVCKKAGIRAVVSTGLCGALVPAFESGDIFVALDVEAPALGLNFRAVPPRSARTHHSGRLVSIDRVVRSVEEKIELRANGADAVEMEAAGVAAEAAKAGLPFFCVRVVMDRAGESFSLDLNEVRDSGGRFSRPRIVKAALARPRAIVPELVWIERTSRMAARALGDFLADCRFEV